MPFFHRCAVRFVNPKMSHGSMPRASAIGRKAWTYWTTRQPQTITIPERIKTAINTAATIGDHQAIRIATAAFRVAMLAAIAYAPMHTNQNKPKGTIRSGFGMYIHITIINNNKHDTIIANVLNRCFNSFTQRSLSRGQLDENDIRSRNP